MATAGTSVTYSVDTLGRRTKKTVSGTTTNYFHSGSVVISEKQGTTWTDYIFFDDTRIAQQSGSTLAAAKFLHQDHLGSTRVCTDGSGNFIASCDYEPFGEFTSAASCSALPTNYRFAGMEYDSETGLYHTQFRQYDPNQSRWMGVDPLPGSPDDPQSLDRYAYVLNDPVNLADPLGLSHSCPPGCTPVHTGPPGDQSPDGCQCPPGPPPPGNVYPGDCYTVIRDGVPETVCPTTTGCQVQFTAYNCTYCRDTSAVRCTIPSGGSGRGDQSCSVLDPSCRAQRAYQDCVKSFGRTGSLLAEYGSAFGFLEAAKRVGELGSEFLVEHFAGKVAKNTAEHAFQVEANLVAKGIRPLPASQLFRSSTKALLLKVGLGAVSRVNLAITVTGTSIDAYCRLTTGGAPQ